MFEWTEIEEGAPAVFTSQTDGNATSGTTTAETSLTSSVSTTFAPSATDTYSTNDIFQQTSEASGTTTGNYFYDGVNVSYAYDVTRVTHYVFTGSTYRSTFGSSRIFTLGNTVTESRYNLYTNTQSQSFYTSLITTILSAEGIYSYVTGATAYTTFSSSAGSSSSSYGSTNGISSHTSSGSSSTLTTYTSELTAGGTTTGTYAFGGATVTTCTTTLSTISRTFTTWNATATSSYATAGNSFTFTKHTVTIDGSTTTTSTVTATREWHTTSTSTTSYTEIALSCGTTTFANMKSTFHIREGTCDKLFTCTGMNGISQFAEVWGTDGVVETQYAVQYVLSESITGGATWGQTEGSNSVLYPTETNAPVLIISSEMGIDVHAIYLPFYQPYSAMSATDGYYKSYSIGVAYTVTDTYEQLTRGQGTVYIRGYYAKQVMTLHSDDTLTMLSSTQTATTTTTSTDYAYSIYGTTNFGHQHIPGDFTYTVKQGVYSVTTCDGTHSGTTLLTATETYTTTDTDAVTYTFSGSTATLADGTVWGYESPLAYKGTGTDWFGSLLAVTVISCED